MADIRAHVLGEEPRTRWVEVFQTGEEWTWTRRNLDGEEEQAQKTFKSRQEAEEAALKAKGNAGLEVAVGPNPDHWEQQHEVVEVYDPKAEEWVPDDGKKKGEKRIRKGGRSIPTGRA